MTERTRPDAPLLPFERALSRRLFLQSSAGWIVPFALGSRLLAQDAPAPPRGPSTLRVGLVGCGGRGTGAALQAISAEDGTVVLSAMGDVFADQLDASLANLLEAAGEELAPRIQVPEENRFVGFDAYRRVIDSGVDVVILTTPPYFRPEHLRYAVNAGKHVFCEKPVAVDAPGIRSVLASAQRAQEANLALVCGFCWRYNVRHRALYQRVHDGALGAIRAVYSTYNATPLHVHHRDPKWTEMEFQLRNWQHFAWLSGDHIVEQAVHSLDKQAWTLNDAPPERVTAIGGRQARFGEERGDVYDHFSATFDYADGVKAFHMSRQMENCSTDNSDFIWGAKGRAIVNGWEPLHEIIGDEPWVYDGPGNDMYQQEHDELFASIRAKAPRNDGVWMAHSSLLAIVARMAAYTGQTIAWDQALDSEEKLGPDEVAFDAAPPPVDVAIPGKRKFM